MNKTPVFKRFFSQELFLVCLIFSLVIVLSQTGVFDYFNWKVFDILVNLKRSTPEHRDNVVFVCIDQKSMKEFADNEISWPWPREFHGRLVSHLTECGAKAIVFDVIFSEQDIDRYGIGGTGEDSDNDFAYPIAESERTYLVVAAQTVTVTESDLRESRLHVKNSTPFQRLSHLISYKSAVFPLQKFSKGARGLGLANLEPENDGIHRRYSLVSKLGEKYVPSIAFAVVQDILDDETLKHRILDHAGENTFIDNEGKFILNWYGKGGTGRGGDETDAVFKYYSYHAVIASAIDEEKGKIPILPRDTFKDKIIIIGSNAPGLFDLKATPFTHKNLYPGMEIHATAIENMLDGDFIYPIPFNVLLLCLAAITLVLFGVEKLFKNLRIFIGVYVVFSVFELVLSYLFLNMYNRWISSAEIFGTTTFVFAGLVISGYFKETKEKRVLRGHFGRYVNDTVLKEILENPTSVDFKGRTITATIMATDIAGFTSISEKLAPYEVVARLNDYLSEVSETLIDNGAYINKYIGDAILALYGAFGEAEHMKKACYAASYAQKIINRKVEEARGEHEDPFVTRFGLTTGEMTMGNIGSERKIEYTVIGDTVNTAFRLEGLNKFYKTTILVGANTRNGAGDDFEFRLLDILRVKGKETPEKVFELLGLKGEIDPERLRVRDGFEKALKLYQTRKFNEAKEIFSGLAAGGDPTSEVFEMRCDNFIMKPPPPEWNGVWVMMRK